ncbi:hypothetical protein JOF56_007856 [Kibdelosporangium banguiense]|uniref:Uncharacterized protein n=1 Tax=Kibdelosporangium banguiense TaxID=1365924 RepID=A0ABS4TST3_9PSEU|nr:hypothetical protein [Kibdelosporangium banguiense]MBP2327471.1 hypothetical protein [Kibdelosporangium banguiense]
MREQPQQDPDYALDPDGMKQSIEWYLDPVIKRVREIDGGFKTAHDDVAKAYENEGGGWFGGEGNGVVRTASSSFFNETEWQLRQVLMEHTELAESLEEYKAALQTHIQGAKNRETVIANRFLAVDSHLQGLGY